MIIWIETPISVWKTIYPFEIKINMHAQQVKIQGLSGNSFNHLSYSLKLLDRNKKSRISSAIIIKSTRVISGCNRIRE